MIYNQLITDIAKMLKLRPEALQKFVTKYNLDPNKLIAALKEEPKFGADLASAIAGYDENLLSTAIADKYQIDENRIALDFFTTKHGLAIANILKMNHHKFADTLVAAYLEDLNTSDMKWARIMDAMANSLCLDHTKYDTYSAQLDDMLIAIEKLYPEYLEVLDERLVIKKSDLKKVIAEAVRMKRKRLKRYRVTEPQFEKIVLHALDNSKKQVAEKEQDDSFTVTLQVEQLGRFKKFINGLPGLRLTKLQRAGNTLYIGIKADDKKLVGLLSAFMKEDLNR